MLEMLQQIFAWIMPRICVACDFNSYDLYHDLCEHCKKLLPWSEDRCYRCGLTLEPKAESIICIKCLETPPAYNRLCALFSYQAPITIFVNQLKFSDKLYFGPLFASLFAEAIIHRWYNKEPLPELIIPMPLHRKRFRRRGYNQAYEIAKPLAKILNLPVDLFACKRIKYTQQQSRLDKIQRHQNVLGAFAVPKPLKYKHVAIVDDVVTTGSTVKSLSLALLAAGVEIIDVWCVARV